MFPAAPGKSDRVNGLSPPAAPVEAERPFRRPRGPSSRVCIQDGAGGGRTIHDGPDRAMRMESEDRVEGR